MKAVRRMFARVLFPLAFFVNHEISRLQVRGLLFMPHLCRTSCQIIAEKEQWKNRWMSQIGNCRDHICRYNSFPIGEASA
uniref:Uncharacterized protein n=1 Tax=Utricularia reniformis TaxID=192314 RepID=A0A1Y0B1T1_9LAMI|nr:hypothetical protein AEK19_MT1194 [Utricularia reniformis]ART31406.1 hypothetical protein AEK19_MT1194 [Utricularia reniformis]